MPRVPTKQVTKQDLEKSRLSAVIHDVSVETEAKDLEHILIRQIGVPAPGIHLGKPYKTDHGEKRRKVYLNFKNEERVNELMKIGSIKHHGRELKISRYIPNSCPMFRYITYSLLVTIYKTEENNRYRELTEYDLKKYFEKFGQIIDCDWQSKNKTILQFQNYDSVDQIILHDVLHTIRGIKVGVEKAISKETAVISADNLRPYCVHMTNMPVDVTSEELSVIFSVHVADILLRPGHQLSSHLVSEELSTSEAWIKHMSDQRTAQDFANKHLKVEIRGFKIHCDVIREPFNTLELCRNFEKGECKFSRNSCNYKHIMCNESDLCDDKECWYGHSKKRQITSDRQHAQDTDKSSYRVRISSLPSTITKEQLLKRLNIGVKYLDRLRFSDKPVPDEPMVAYLVNQPSENLLRKNIREWHYSPFSPDISNIMKCQLEWNMDFFDWDDHSGSLEVLAQNQASLLTSDTINDTRPVTTKLAPWYNGKKDIPSTSVQTEQSTGTALKLTDANNTPKIPRKKAIKVHDQGPSSMIKPAPQWCWTSKKLSDDQATTAAVHSLVDKTNKTVNAAIKVYKTELNQTVRRCAQHERIILEKLQGLDGIPKLIATNINARVGVKSNNDPRIITEHVEGVTLNEYIRTNSISFRDKLIITLKLLHIVKQIHSRNIVHRHINPDNIMITTQLVDAESNHNLLCSDEINLIMIGYGRACITQDIVPNHTMISEDDHDYIQDTFYQAPQLERQSSTEDDNEHQLSTNIVCSPTIDTSSICAVLFWMITNCYPRESRNILKEAPHQRKDHFQRIIEELMRATGIWTGTENRGPLEQHLRLIFDRGFDVPHQQWSMEELEYQLQHTTQLATRNNEEKSVFSPSVSKNQIKSSLSTSQPDSFLQLASLIDWMKRQFEIHYPSVHWSINDKSRWSSHGQQIENSDLLTFQKQPKSIVIEIICYAKINKNQELFITIMAKRNGTSDKELPLGVWKQYEQEKVKQEILKSFEVELKILIDILYRNKDYVIS